MVIRKMTEQDVPYVAALEKKCFNDPWSERSIAFELNNSLAYWLVAEKDGCVVGYVGSQSVLDAADMMNIAVDETCRREGIANALVGNLVKYLTGIGVSSLSLEVRSGNAPAIALYTKLGFSLVGRRPNYYRNPREDALILRKECSI